MRPERMMMWAALTAISMAAMASSAMAGACEDNYGATGIPLVTGITFSTYQDFSKVDPATALKRMARVVKSEGYSGIKVNSTNKRGSLLCLYWASHWAKRSNPRINRSREVLWACAP